MRWFRRHLDNVWCAYSYNYLSYWDFAHPWCRQCWVPCICNKLSWRNPGSTRISANINMLAKIANIGPF